jgi:hypothetical protein
MDGLNAASEPLDFHRPILEPSHFHGRKALLDAFLQRPWRVLILLGGLGMGKSSVLNQFAFHLKRGTAHVRMLPVSLNLNRERPGDTKSLLHLLLSGLENACGETFVGPTPESITTLMFESRLSGAIDRLRHDEYSGVCFLLDECEKLVGQDWWKDDASGILRSLLESSRFGTRVGFILTGFRAVRDHRQQVGSRLMHDADWEYLAPLTLDEIAALIIGRCGQGNMSDQEIKNTYRQSGGHPWLAQRLVSLWLETRTHDPRLSVAQLSGMLRDQRGDFFEDCWGEKGYAAGLSDSERKIYRVLLQLRATAKLSVSAAAEQTVQSENGSRQALRILEATGVAISTGLGRYQLGSRLFADWVRANRAGRGESVPASGTGKLQLTGTQLRELSDCPIR